MSLADDITKFQDGISWMVPSAVMELFARKTKELVHSGLAEKALKAGSKMPAFALPNAAGKIVSSDELLKKGPLVLCYYRGIWCPYCKLELKAYQQILPKIRELGAEFVAISPQLQEKSGATVAKHSLTYEVLSDKGNHFARNLGIVFNLDPELRTTYSSFGYHVPDFNGDESFDLPFPATYVVAKDGTIAHAFVNADYVKRAEPDDILKVLKTIVI